VVCGDGVREGGESCDASDFGGEGRSCSEYTSFEHGTVGCTTDCKLDVSQCNTCGNGEIEGGEECDGENLGGATCESLGAASGSLSCTAQCELDLSECVGACGNGVMEEGEECDGEDFGDQTCESLGFQGGSLSCSGECLVDTSECDSGGCGDGHADADEQCDGGDLKGASCSSLGYDDGELGCLGDCTFDISGCGSTAECGNGITEQGEQCDDGNQVDTDACTSECRMAECGDGFVWAGMEECDDGNTSNTDACLGSCEMAECGDGFVWAGIEGCDDGNTVGGDGCSSTCSLESCGNGVVDPGEECDDGNGDNSDSCPDGTGGTCASAGCGDGFVWMGTEMCDDGNDVLTDSCPSGPSGPCEPAVCGDGFVWTGIEECDDGDSSNGDGCSASCTVEAGWECSGQQSICNVVGMTWISIPAGSFDMGSTSGDSDEQPVHSVDVPAFQMTETEVTIEQYGQCVAQGPCSEPDMGDVDCNWLEPGRESHPVNCVTWSQADDFCSWAGGRLPTEAEWEYAATSAGQNITYPWGNTLADCTYAVMEEPVDGCGTGHTWEVCSKTPGNTDQGLCDMAGNVWEWVQDSYHTSYLGAPDDGSAWESPTIDERVYRGGDFGNTATYLRSASRHSSLPQVDSSDVGFRCAREVP
jgi:cysteine-rich repeat protein